MNGHFYRMLWGVLAIALAFAPIADVASAQEPMTLSFLTNGSPQYVESTRAFIEEFERANPDIKIEMSLGGVDKFLTSLAGGTPPDIVRLYAATVPEMAARGLIQNLTPFLAKSGVDTADFVPAIWNRGLSYRGNPYAVAYGIGVTGMFYNKDLFAQTGLGTPDASWRWESEGLEAGRKLTQSGADGTIERYFLPSIPRTEVGPFMYSAGGGYFSDDERTAIIDRPESVQGVQFVRDLMWQYEIAAPPGSSVKFTEGTTAAFNVGSWYLSEMNNVDSFDWDVAPLPSLYGGRGTDIWPETPVAIPAGVPHPDLSWRFLEFIVSKEGQTSLAELGLATPPLKLSVGSDILTDLHPRVSTDVFLELAVLPETKPYPTAPSTALEPLWSALTEILNNEAPVASTLAEAAERSDVALERFWADVEAKE